MSTTRNSALSGPEDQTETKGETRPSEVLGDATNGKIVTNGDEEDPGVATNYPRPLGGRGGRGGGGYGGRDGGSGNGGGGENTAKDDGKRRPNDSTEMQEAENLASTTFSVDPNKFTSTAQDTVRKHASTIATSVSNLIYNPSSKEYNYKDKDTNASPQEHQHAGVVDEVDLTPEEQLTRHRVELDPDKLHHYHPRHSFEQPTTSTPPAEEESSIDQLKNKAVRLVLICMQALFSHTGVLFFHMIHYWTYPQSTAVHAVRAAVERHLHPSSTNANVDYPETLQEAIRGTFVV